MAIPRNFAMLVYSPPPDGNIRGQTHNGDCRGGNDEQAISGLLQV
jgi:hypothetical protein